MAEYRIDDLARAAGMTVRNVRAYQERGLVPPPRLQGRTGWYDDGHLARLRLIGRLLERGYTTAHITDFIATWEAGHDLGQTLGLEAALLAPGSGEIPELLTQDDLVEMFGVLDPSAIDAAVRMGVIEPDGEGRFRALSPRLLRAGAELVALGMPLLDVLDLGAQLRLRVQTVATLFVQAVAPSIIGDHEPGWVPDDADMERIMRLVSDMRPLARVVVDEELTSALETGIADYVTQWLAAAVEATAQHGAG
ncbi:MAG TPA: MerR family transcriptional regulator [Mycobacteriales bacterium]|nr:MerR family transcriptional regulator [Mycobacteriales bacterium]HWA65580.1 MerR family transcriptional regulator [Mycobacteriales bacterium]